MEFPHHSWRTASYTTEQGHCVEVALTPERVGVRDSKHRAGGHFDVSPDAWAAFIAAVKIGAADRA